MAEDHQKLFRALGGSRAPASLETIPLELLNRVFEFSSMEDLDLSLLAVSRSIRWKLVGHPIVKTLRAFCPPVQLVKLFNDCLIYPANSRHRNFDCTEFGADSGVVIQRNILGCSWCTSAFVQRLQIQVVKCMVIKHWDPYLQRDGLQRSILCYPGLWKELEDLARGKPPAEEAEVGIKIKVVDSDMRYSWTRLRLWPLQGRVAIRDQLFNETVEEKIPLLQSISSARHEFQRAAQIFEIGTGMG